MTFKDHFSGHAAEYAQFRPRYPASLFVYLANQAPTRDVAWDCATGNGQAALGLAAHFQRVIATDASAPQIEAAERHERVDYLVAPAEQSGLPPSSVDVVSVAQALHWFDIPAFFAEAKRVLKPRGIIAVWAYTFLTVTPETDQIVDDFYRVTTGPFWPPERDLVERGYRDVSFPFHEIAAPQFEMEAHWRLEQVLGYLRTWSTTKRFIAARGFDPVDELGEELRDVWPDGARSVRWPIHIRVGRAPAWQVTKQ
jgi:SAM-dependent methyltransferase